MGSGNSKDFYTFAEAAKKIGRSSRTVHKYVEQGVIRARRENRRVLLNGEDVEVVARDLGTNLPPLNKKGFFQLVARVQKLEQDMAVLRRMNDIRGDPLRPGPEIAKELFRSAAAALTAGRWSVEEIKSWAGIFDRLDEIALSKIGAATGEQAPWEPFYKLCLQQMLAVFDAPDFSTSLALQELHQQLDQGRKVIRGTIITTVELSQGRLSPVVLDVLDDRGAAVARRLAANRLPPGA